MDSMTRSILKKWPLLIEAILYLVMFSAIVHCLTSDGVTLLTLGLALGLILLLACAAFSSVRVRLNLDKNLVWVITALGAGFFLFSSFRFAGLVSWPLAHPRDISDYLFLLYNHGVLTINVLAPVLLVWVMTRPSPRIRWGDWTENAVSQTGRILLSASALVSLSMALGAVLLSARNVQGPWMGFLVICILKACLTGGTEEVCYRGILQPLCIKRFGVVGGILFQACLYAVFHMHLGRVFFPGAGFLAGVFVLGLIFGAVSRVTSGIGWAFIIHLSLNIVIEWQNIS